MRVCVVAYKTYETSPRVSLFVKTLAQRGDTVDVVCLRSENQARRALSGRVQFHRIQRHDVAKNSLTYSLGAARFFFHASLLMSTADRYDLIYVFSVPDFLVLSATVAKARGAKAILDVYDIVPEFYMSRFSHERSTVALRLLLLLEKISMSFADYVVASNDVWRRRLISRSVDGQKCATVDYYSDPEVFFPRPRTRASNEFIFVYPGSLQSHQGVDVAIRAFARVVSVSPQARFAIYGEGPEKEKLARLVAYLGLNGTVSFYPEMPYEDIASVLANCDVGIAPRKVSSCFGNEATNTKIFDFMALGLPVLTTRTRAESEMFDGTELVFFESENEEDLASCMLRLMRDEKLRATLVQRAYARLSGRSWQEARKRFLQIIDSVCPQTSIRGENCNRLSSQGHCAVSKNQDNFLRP